MFLEIPLFEIKGVEMSRKIGNLSSLFTFISFDIRRYLEISVYAVYRLNNI